MISNTGTYLPVTSHDWLARIQLGGSSSLAIVRYLLFVDSMGRIHIMQKKVRSVRSNKEHMYRLKSIDW